jgi:hypothetical protein
MTASERIRAARQDRETEGRCKVCGDPLPALDKTLGLVVCRKDWLTGWGQNEEGQPVFSK